MEISFGPTPPGGQSGQVKMVLNVGSGPNVPNRLHQAFRGRGWKEVRLDIDPEVRPDLVGSVTDLTSIDDDSFDAVLCSHNLEHVHQHQVIPTLREFNRILNSAGFVFIRTPDLEAVAELITAGRLDDTAYRSPAGPITALDMIYGHSQSIANGNNYMAHHTGFTRDSLGRLLLQSGFSEAYIIKNVGFELCAIALMQNANRHWVAGLFKNANLNFFGS